MKFIPLLLVLVAGTASAEPVLFPHKTPAEVSGIIASSCAELEDVTLAQPNLVICTSFHQSERYVIFQTPEGSQVVVHADHADVEAATVEHLRLLAALHP